MARASLRHIETVRRLERIGRALAASRPTKPTRIRVDSTLDLVPILSPQFGRPNHLSTVFARLDQVPFVRVKACVAIPPRHFKSTTAHHWVARLLERHPWMKVLYLSYNVTFAAENSAAIQALALRAGVELGRVQRQERWTTAEGGGLWSASFDSPLTGRGFHLIVIDDPHQNRAEVESNIIRGKVNKAVRADVITRGQPDGPKAWPRGFPGTSIVVFATRWNEDDVTGNLIGTSPNAMPNADRYEYFCLPAIDDEGRPLAPDFWTLESLEELRRGMPHYDWVSLYQGRPEPSGGRLFGDVILVEPSAIPSEGRFGIGVDLARTAKQRSDSHAACAMQRTGDEYFIREVRSKQCRLTSEDRTDASGKHRFVPGFVQDIRALQTLYGGARTGQHTGGIEDFTLELLATLETTERVYIEAIPAKVSKRERAGRFIHDWNHGRVKLPLGADWVPAFVSKIVSFTGEEGGADDEIDAAVTAHHLLQGADVPAVISARSHPATDVGRPAAIRSTSSRRGGMW